MLYRVVADIDPRYRESAEESLVETSHLLASLIEQDVKAGAIDTTRLEPLFKWWGITIVFWFVLG